MTRIQSRRGVALFVVMLFVVAVGLMALAAIASTGNAALVAKSYARENDLRYAAEAALAIGKSRINFDPTALPDTGYKTLLKDQPLTSADGQPINGVTVTVYAGPSGSTSGQFGRFASVVAEARDPQGNGFIRRLELSQESFAKYAYWSDRESNGGTTIYFGGGDQLWGPVWSNDVISIMASGATFNDAVATAKTISGKPYGTFRKGYKENQAPIALPSTASLSSKLSGLASSGGFSFTAPSAGNETTVRLRVEFVAIDMNADGDSLDVGEGFFKVYVGNTAAWTRGDWPSSNPTPAQLTQCGDWHAVVGATDQKFFPASVHATTWFRQMMQDAGMSASAASAESSATVPTIMQHTGARCYLGGDPHLVAVQRTTAQGYAIAAIQKGGDDTTFTATDQYGAWTRFTTTPASDIALKRPWDAQYLFPIYRGYNPGAKGVIYVSGTAGVSGVLRDKITLFATGTIVVLDDTRYANDPSLGQCQDMLGLLSSNNVVVADNALNTPQRVKSTNPTVTKNVDDTKDLYLHAVVMALNTSFMAQNYSGGPYNANNCEGSVNGRGCLYLSGGLIQQSRGPVGMSSGQGFIKRYSYDRCAIVNPPPYFPTTGRFADNRYYELNPVGFDPAALYRAITPAP